MKQSVMLTITSLLTLLFLSFHHADDVVRVVRLHKRAAARHRMRRSGREAGGVDDRQCWIVLAAALREECGNQWKKGGGGLFRRSFSIRKGPRALGENLRNSKVFLTSPARSIEGRVYFSGRRDPTARKPASDAPSRDRSRENR